MDSFKCRICGGNKYTSLFQWNVPLAAAVTEQIEKSKKYPIEPVICFKCGHVQLKETLDVDMYSDYLYTASFARGFQQHIKSLADDIDSMKIETNGKKRIIEIGSSNGYFLKQMQIRGWDVLGFEPAETFSSLANQNDIYTQKMYFGDTASLKAVENWGEPNVVIMRHVLEHLDNPNAMIESISHILSSGYLIIEVPYLAKEVAEKQFYAFYHEHLSYFSVNILKRLLNKYGFKIIDIKENSLGGGSITICAYIGKFTHQNSPVIAAYLESEKKICSIENILNFTAETTEQIHRIRKRVEQERQLGNKVAVWGVGQRGVSLLNICELTNADLSYAIDVNRNYWLKYVPGVNIQIVPPSYLDNHFVDVIIILSTGYADEIIAQNNNYIARGEHFLKLIDSKGESEI